MFVFFKINFSAKDTNSMGNAQCPYRRGAIETFEIAAIGFSA